MSILAKNAQVALNSATDMPVHGDEYVVLEIAHVLCMDIVGYSKRSSIEQRASVDRLNESVRESAEFQKAESANRLTKIATGDGMVLVFYTSPEAPAKCAVEVSRGLKKHPDLRVRMGVHSGSVSGTIDVTGRPNLAGAGINIAQRVMDCGDGGHILVSKNAADDLHEYERWRPLLKPLGMFEVKHGVKLHVVNLCNDEIGNARVPTKLRAQKRRTAKKWIGLGAAAVVLAIIGFGYNYFFNRTAEAPAPADIKRIAVLPFKPVVAETRDPVLEMGMADTLITKLSTSRELIVPSLTTVRQSAGPGGDPRIIGNKLHVGSILEGSVQRVGDHLRVTVRLLKVSDGSSVWAAVFDEKFADVFAVQDTIATKVAEALAVRLSGEGRKQFAKRYTESLDAYQLYMTGRYHWANLSPPELQKSIGYFQQATEADPGYALAYFGLAESHRSSTINSDTRPRDVMPVAREAAIKAIALDESLAEPHFTLAMIHMFFDWDWDGAVREAKRAIELNPNFAFGHMALAHVLSDLGRHEEAVAEATRARQLEPVSSLLNMIEGAHLFYAGRIDEADARLQKLLELNPNFWATYYYLGHIAILRGNYSQAADMLKKAGELNRGNTLAPAMIGYIAARSGDTAKARAVLQQLQSLAAERYVPATNLGLVYVGLNDTNAALNSLDRAFDERDVLLQFVKVDRIWDPLRSQPRFVALLKRMGLE